MTTYWCKLLLHALGLRSTWSSWQRSWDTWPDWLLKRSNHINRTHPPALQPTGSRRQSVEDKREASGGIFTGNYISSHVRSPSLRDGGLMACAAKPVKVRKRENFPTNRHCGAGWLTRSHQSGKRIINSVHFPHIHSSLTHNRLPQNASGPRIFWKDARESLFGIIGE